MLNDNQLKALLTQYMTQSGAMAKQTLENILDEGDATRRIYAMVFGDNRRAALKTLSDIARKKQGREALAPLVKRDAGRLIATEDDKARKSVYKLIGLCAPDACADKLTAALKSEKTRFVRPSIILALGNTQDPEEHLKGYIIEPGEEKHMQAEREALKKALGKTVRPQKAALLRLPPICLLTYNKREALALELAARRCRYEYKDGLFEVETAQTAKLRCYAEALFDVGAAGDYAAISRQLDAIGCQSQSYRIEAGSIHPEKRKDAIRAVSAGMAEHGYQDNPSAYAFELRIWKGRLCAVFADSRFSYRKESISASINTVTAASIMRFSEAYMRADAEVLDPFCGSGTMLIERGFLKPARKLVGVDISGHAIKAACANRKESGQRIALIHTDILKYSATQYDEVIANMPFGIRVSRHADNLRLYAAFVDKLPSLLKKGGHAFLLTQEKKLLRSALDKQSALRIIKEEDFESGGLCPRLFIIIKE